LEDIKNMNVSNWKKVAQNRDSWKKVVSKPESCTGCSALYEEEKGVREGRMEGMRKKERKKRNERKALIAIQ